MKGTCRLEAVTSSYRALEGKRTTFTLLNETHHWVAGNAGHKMYETIDGNATKKDSRYLAITNAYLPGEDSVAERMREAFEKIEDGKAADIGFPVRLTGGPRAHAPHARGPEDRPPEDPWRFRLAPARDDHPVRPRHHAVALALSAHVAQPSGGRGGRALHQERLGPARGRRPLAEVWRRDRPGLRRWQDRRRDCPRGDAGAATTLPSLIGLWEKPDGPRGENWIVPRDEVDQMVRSAFSVFNVQGFYSDVALWGVLHHRVVGRLPRGPRHQVERT